MNEAKFQAKLREYAKLIVKIGANVQKGQRVRLQAGVDQVLLTQMVTEECYQAGASYVEVIWECGEINKMHYQYATAETLGAVPPWEEERFKQLDELLRSYQKDNKGRAEAAASKIPFFNRKKKFGRNGKKL